MHAGYTGWLATFTIDMPAASGPDALLWQSLFAALIVALTVAVALLARRADLEPATSRSYALGGAPR
jgi:hypothetical protein